MKQNASKTWKNTTSTVLNWWSTASTVATNAYNDAINDDVHLYNRDNDDSVHSSKMQGMSSDAYFNQIGTQNEINSNVNNTYGSSAVKSTVDLLSFDEQNIEQKHIPNISKKEQNKNSFVFFCSIIFFIHHYFFCFIFWIR